MTQNQDPRLNAHPASGDQAVPAPDPRHAAPTRRPYRAPAIESSRIFHGVVLGAFSPFACGAGS